MSQLRKIKRKSQKMSNVVIDLTFPACVTNEKEFTGADIIRTHVMTLPYWRTGGIEVIDAAQEIESALDVNSEKPSISPDAKKKLGEAMKMEGLMVTMPENMLRFYRKVHRAVLVADKASE